MSEPAAQSTDKTSKVPEPAKVEVAGRRPDEIIAEIELFRGLSRTYLARIAELGEEVEYKRNAKIFEEGDEGEKFYVILEGAVRISRFVPGMGEEALAVLRSGHYFGEMALVDDGPRSATALAHEKTRLFEVGRKDLESLLFVDRDFAYEFLWNVVRTLTRRLRQANDKMTFFATANKF